MKKPEERRTKKTRGAAEIVLPTKGELREKETSRRRRRRRTQPKSQVPSQRMLRLLRNKRGIRMKTKCTSEEDGIAHTYKYMVCVAVCVYVHMSSRQYSYYPFYSSKMPTAQHKKNSSSEMLNLERQQPAASSRQQASGLPPSPPK